MRFLHDQALGIFTALIGVWITVSKSLTVLQNVPSIVEIESSIFVKAHASLAS